MWDRLPAGHLDRQDAGPTHFLARASGSDKPRRFCHGPANRRRKIGFIDVEIITALALLALITGTLASVLRTYRSANQAMTWRQTALAAAQAQFQRYQAGAPIGSNPPAGVVPEELKLKTDAKPGTGDWRGFNHITVTATFDGLREGPIRETVQGYVPGEVRP